MIDHVPATAFRPLHDNAQIAPAALAKMSSFHSDVVAEVERSVAASPIVVVGMAQNPHVKNVRAALKLVALGEAVLGIVYQTDAKAEPGVRIVGTLPEDSHPAIVYPVAQTAGSKDDDTPAFLKCLQSAKARDLFEAEGFTYLAPATSN